MSDGAIPEGRGPAPARAAAGGPGRGLSVVDAFLALAAIRHPTSPWWLRVRMMGSSTRYSQRTLRRALARLEAAGYVVHEGKEYSMAPAILIPPNKFLPPTRPGIAEVDLLLLVLSNVRSPKRIFLVLWGGGELAGHIYRDAVRRLVRFGYLRRDSGWRYHPGERTAALLGYDPERAH
jgi:hypothetical protein